MEYNERNITAVEVFKKLEKVQKELEETQKQNKEILARLDDVQKSNALFHIGFATIFEALQIVEEVRAKKELGEMLNAGSVANLLCADGWKKKHMKKKGIELEHVVKVTPGELDAIFDVLEDLRKL